MTKLTKLFDWVVYSLQDAFDYAVIVVTELLLLACTLAIVLGGYLLFK